jgi:hypothetical protein
MWKILRIRPKCIVRTYLIISTTSSKMQANLMPVTLQYYPHAAYYPYIPEHRRYTFGPYDEVFVMEGSYDRMLQWFADPCANGVAVYDDHRGWVIKIALSKYEIIMEYARSEDLAEWDRQMRAAANYYYYSMELVEIAAEAVPTEPPSNFDESVPAEPSSENVSEAAPKVFARKGMDWVPLETILEEDEPEEPVKKPRGRNRGRADKIALEKAKAEASTPPTDAEVAEMRAKILAEKNARKAEQAFFKALKAAAAEAGVELTSEDRAELGAKFGAGHDAKQLIAEAIEAAKRTSAAAAAEAAEAAMA